MVLVQIIQINSTSTNYKINMKRGCFKYDDEVSVHDNFIRVWMKTSQLNVAFECNGLRIKTSFIYSISFIFFILF